MSYLSTGVGSGQGSGQDNMTKNVYGKPSKKMLDLVKKDLGVGSKQTENSTSKAITGPEHRLYKTKPSTSARIEDLPSDSSSNVYSFQNTGADEDEEDELGEQDDEEEVEDDEDDEDDDDGSDEWLPSDDQRTTETGRSDVKTKVSVKNARKRRRSLSEGSIYSTIYLAGFKDAGISRKRPRVVDHLARVVMESIEKQGMQASDDIETSPVLSPAEKRAIGPLSKPWFTENRMTTRDFPTDHSAFIQDSSLKTPLNRSGSTSKEATQPSPPIESERRLEAVCHQAWREATQDADQSDVEDEEERQEAALRIGDPKKMFEYEHLGLDQGNCIDDGVKVSTANFDGDPRLKKSKLYHEKLDMSIFELAAVVWSSELESVFARQDQYYLDWLLSKVVLQILASTRVELLRAIIDGSVYSAYKRNPVVRKELDSNLSKGNDQPGIYLQEFADSKGLSPTPRQWSQILEVMETYCKDPKYITTAEAQELLIIDHMVGSRYKGDINATSRGKLRYLQKRNKRSRARPRNILEFIKQLSGRFPRLQDDNAWDKPMDSCITEIGYALAPVTRLDDHRLHQSSNYIMNLTEAVSLRVFGDQFLIRRMVIFPIFECQQACIAEKLFTTMAQGYSKTGTGFSHYLAGISATSVKKICEERYIEYRRRAIKETKLLSNLRAVESYLMRKTSRIETEQRLLETEQLERDLMTRLKDLELEAGQQEIGGATTLRRSLLETLADAEAACDAAEAWLGEQEES